MLPIPPLASAAYAATQIRQADDKAQHVRRLQQLARNAAATGDRYEHSVESAEELKPVQDESDRSREQKKRKKKPPQDQPQIDLKA